MRKILLVEDDLVTHKLVKHALGADFELISCYTVAQGIEALESANELSAVILDRSLPDGDGISICLRLRQDSRLQSIPVLFLSGAGSETEKVGAFYAGADDYITKPFGPMELKARIQARLKKQTNRICVANLELDLDTHRVFLNDQGSLKEIDLTRTEFKILSALTKAMDQVFTRDALLNKVWGLATNVSDRVVDSHISHLRRKLFASGLTLESLRGEGYRLSCKSNSIDQAA